MKLVKRKNKKKKIKKIHCLVMDLVLRIKYYMLDVINVFLCLSLCENAFTTYSTLSSNKTMIIMQYQ